MLTATSLLPLLRDPVRLLALALLVPVELRLLLRVSNLSLTVMATPATAEVRMPPARPATMPPTVPRLLAATLRLPTTATTLPPLLTKMLELKATETLESAPTDHGTEMDPRTPTSDSAPPPTDPLRTTLATTDMLSPLLTPTHTVPSPLRPTVIPLSRTVPVATNSEEPLLPLPTRLDTRRTSTESGVASTAPRSDTESLAPRPTRPTTMVVAPLRTTVHALVPLAPAELLPPLMAPTHGVVPAVTGLPLALVSRAPVPMHLVLMMAPPRCTATPVTNPTPTPHLMRATRASPTRPVAMVTPLMAAPLTELSETPRAEASLTTGLAREVPPVPLATVRVLPTRRLTTTAGMPPPDTTPLLRLLVASDRETRLLLHLVASLPAALVATTPLLVATWLLPPLVASEMAATVESQATEARRPTVPMTDNTETRPPVELPLAAVLSPLVARELLDVPSTVLLTLTTLASAETHSAVDSPMLLKTSAVLVASAKVATTTVMLMLVAALLPLAALDSAVLLLLVAAVDSDALPVLVAVASLPALVVSRASPVRAMVATLDTAVLAATVVAVATVAHLASASLVAVVASPVVLASASLVAVLVASASPVAVVASVVASAVLEELVAVVASLVASAVASVVPTAVPADTAVASAADTAVVPDTAVASAAVASAADMAAVPDTVAVPDMAAATAATATDIEQ